MAKFLKQAKYNAKSMALEAIRTLRNFRIDKGGLAYRMRMLSSTQTPIEYLGWLGHKNFGDELVYWACRDIFFPERALFPSEAKPLEYKMLRQLGQTGDSERHQAVMLGGGTLILREEYLRPLERAVEKGLQIVIFGTGVADISYTLAYERPKHEEIFIDRWRKIIQSSLFIGVRGQRSVETLRSIGIDNARMIGDPALGFSLEKYSQDGCQSSRVGVNLGAHDKILGDAAHVQTIVLGCLKKLIEMGYSVDFFSLHSYDTQIGRKISSELPSHLFRMIDCNKLGWHASFEQMAQCKLAIGQRLHFVVSAAAAGVPFISLSYQPKCLDFVESINSASEGLSTDRLNESGLWSSVERVINDREKVLVRQTNGVAHVRGLLREAAQCVRHLF